MIILYWIFSVCASSSILRDYSTEISDNVNGKRDGDTDPKNMLFRIRRHTEIDPSTEKRTVVLSKPIIRRELVYFINIDIGTPPQRIEVELNLKHRGTYVATSSQSRSQVIGRVSMDKVVKEAHYYPARSYTYKYLSNAFNSYTDFFGSSWASYGSDELRLGASVFENFTFIGFEQPSERTVIGLGIGRSIYVTSDQRRESSTNLFIQMKERGWCAMAAYSIWIGSESSTVSGSLLLNAIDFRYTISDIYIFPLLDTGRMKGYFIKIDAIKRIGLDGNVTEVCKLSMPIELDFNMVFSRLPHSIVERLYDSLNEYGLHLTLSCEEEAKRGSIALVFSGVQFVFPYSSILPQCQNGEKFSSLPFLPSSKAILGANFLSMLYMVVDLEKEEIGLAMARTDTGVELVKETVEPLTRDIPGIRAPYYSSKLYYDTFSLIDTDSVSKLEPDQISISHTDTELIRFQNEAVVTVFKTRAAFTN